MSTDDMTETITVALPKRAYAIVSAHAMESGVVPGDMAAVALIAWAQANGWPGEASVPFRRLTPRPLSERQRRVLASIHRLKTSRGLCPSRQEIADEVGISASSVQGALLGLVKKGAVRIGGWRRIDILPAGDTILSGMGDD